MNIKQPKLEPEAPKPIQSGKNLQWADGKKPTPVKTERGEFGFK